MAPAAVSVAQLLRAGFARTCAHVSAITERAYSRRELRASFTSTRLVVNDPQRLHDPRRSLTDILNLPVRARTMRSVVEVARFLRIASRRTTRAGGTLLSNARYKSRGGSLNSRCIIGVVPAGFAERRLLAESSFLTLPPASRLPSAYRKNSVERSRRAKV